MQRLFITSFFISVLLFSFSCSNAPKSQSDSNGAVVIDSTKYADIKFKEDFFDFGTITSGEVVSHTFHFYNAGDNVLIIKDLIPDCGCTMPKIEKKTINPGEEGTIEVIFNSKGWYGSQYKSVTVRSNSPIREKSVTIKANVIEGKE